MTKKAGKMAAHTLTTILFCHMLAFSITMGAPRHRRMTKRSDDISMASLQTLIQQQANLIQNLQAKLTATETKLTSTETKMAQLENQINAQASHDHTQDNKITSLQNSLTAKTKEAGFTARFLHDPVNNTGDHGTLKFDGVLSNVGGGYDPHTGIFTAPVAGLYAFFFEMTTSNDITVILMKEGREVARLHGEAIANTWDKTSTQVAVHLAKGNRVWIEHHNYETRMRGGPWTVFTGILVQAD